MIRFDRPGYSFSCCLLFRSISVQFDQIKTKKSESTTALREGEGMRGMKRRREGEVEGWISQRRVEGDEVKGKMKRRRRGRESVLHISA